MDEWLKLNKKKQVHEVSNLIDDNKFNLTNKQSDKKWKTKRQKSCDLGQPHASESQEPIFYLPSGLLNYWWHHKAWPVSFCLC